MSAKAAGNQWLKDHYNLSGYSLTHSSYINHNESIELTAKGNIEQVYGIRYAPTRETPLDHIEFALKYDDLSLDFLKAVFAKIPVSDIISFIEASPSGKYSRMVGYLYEFLSGNTLELNKSITGNYIDLLDKQKYQTGMIIKISKWRINDNQLGTASFCPIVRKTKTLKEVLETDTREKIKLFKSKYAEDIFRRAIHYLYNKETRSSYEIEKEKPSPDRMEKFIAMLVKAGDAQTSEMFTQERLIVLQNAIVDPRFAAREFRDFQNYIGESLPSYLEYIHYICPPPAFVQSMMHGLQETAAKMIGTPAELKAAILSFAFVFIHPFEDGNGRLHRFLIHDILVHEGLVPQGLIIPVSAHMLNHIKEYNQVLEKYSHPLMRRVRFDKKDDGGIEVLNSSEIEGYFRYPDLTAQCIYLAETIHATIDDDMPDELDFIQRYDEVKMELQRLVDMPDKDISLMILFLHQNKGVFPKRRRGDFSKLTDQEIASMQSAYRKIFGLSEI
jgi:hypothetical protein